MPMVTAYIVTYRRHDMLRRAIGSVLKQTCRDILVKVINDDPDDDQVQAIIEDFHDPRVALFLPVQKRGATRNFNLMFDEQDAHFVSLLEDDNWWEPTFLASMTELLAANPDDDVAICNERIWRELPDGVWEDTGTEIWPFADTRRHIYSIEEICGSAKLCNSAMLVRTRRAAGLKTPDTIPVDVTEHFRERLLPTSILLHGRALVNYAVTLHTWRSTEGNLWGRFQTMLIGSVFAALPSPEARRSLARRLWSECDAPTSPRAVSLVSAGFAVPEALPLIMVAPMPALARFALWALRAPHRLRALRSRSGTWQEEFDFLVQAPLTQALALSPALPSASMSE